jgi:hypothetical protein
MANLDQFRSDVRAWLEANCPAEMRQPMTREEDTFWGGRNTTFASEAQRVWFERMRDKGWTVPHWPKEYGGGGLDGEETKILRQEMAAISARLPLVSFGISMLGPALLKYGTEAQKREHLPKIAAGLIRWCQGYSEPNAGSDLASLQTRAEPDGTDFIINGQKIWTSYANYADWIFCLVRTDPAAKPQRGISMLLIDMKTSGITVRPTVLLDGTPEVNEIWFENVRVPVANRVGDENLGWTYAKYLLGHERANIAGVGTSKRELRRLKHIATVELRGGRPLLDDPEFRRRLARVEIDLLALEYTNLRALSAPATAPSAAVDASILKIRGSEIRQALSELMVEAIGLGALRFGARGVATDGGALAGIEHAAGVTASYLNLRKLSIFGGSNEIQKNIVAQTLIGL